jgi:hypothetical protein
VLQSIPAPKLTSRKATRRHNKTSRRVSAARPVIVAMA